MAEQQSDLVLYSLAGDSLNTLADLLESGSDQDRLKAAFSRLPKRALLKWYRSLIADLANSGADVVIEVGQPKPNSERRIVLTKSELPAIIDALHGFDSAVIHTLSLIVELVGYDKDSNWFHVRDLAEQRDYRGKATGLDAIESARRARISSRYAVHMLEIIDI